MLLLNKMRWKQLWVVFIWKLRKVFSHLMNWEGWDNRLVLHMLNIFIWTISSVWLVRDFWFCSWLLHSWIQEQISFLFLTQLIFFQSYWLKDSLMILNTWLARVFFIIVNVIFIRVIILLGQVIIFILLLLSIIILRWRL